MGDGSARERDWPHTVSNDIWGRGREALARLEAHIAAARPVHVMFGRPPRYKSFSV